MKGEHEMKDLTPKSRKEKIYFYFLRFCFLSFLFVRLLGKGNTINSSPRDSLSQYSSLIFPNLINHITNFQKYKKPNNEILILKIKLLFILTFFHNPIKPKNEHIVLPMSTCTIFFLVE